MYESNEPIITVSYNPNTQTYEARQILQTSSQMNNKKDSNEKVLATGTYMKNYNNNGIYNLL